MGTFDGFISSGAIPKAISPQKTLRTKRTDVLRAYVLRTYLSLRFDESRSAITLQYCVNICLRDEIDYSVVIHNESYFCDGGLSHMSIITFRVNFRAQKLL